jgi:Fe-S cluster biogenesis protein NfuA/nitrite reductase/ring-hydroxylating ferredoxin subunit
MTVRSKPSNSLPDHDSADNPREELIRNLDLESRMTTSANESSLTAGKLPERSWPAGANDAQEQLEAMNSHGARIQQLLEQIEALPSPSTRELVHEFMEATLAFYGHGLARILQVVHESGPNAQKAYQHLINDKVVRGLLLIHDLHPKDLETRLRDALDQVRPYLQSHGGNVDLISLTGQAARLRLQGTCKSCASSAVTLELAIRHAIEEACPDLAGFEVEGVSAEYANPATVAQPPEHAKPSWIPLENAQQLDDGAWMPVRVAGKRLVVCRVDGNLYAYRNNCPACNMPFDAGVLEAGLLHCPLGHRYDVQHAGRCAEMPAAHLDPFPLLLQEGIVRVALTL